MVDVAPDLRVVAVEDRMAHRARAIAALSLSHPVPRVQTGRLLRTFSVPPDRTFPALGVVVAGHAGATVTVTVRVTANARVTVNVRPTGNGEGTANGEGTGGIVDAAPG